MNLVIRKIKKRSYRRLFDGAINEAVQISPMEDLKFVVSRENANLVKFGGKVEYQNVDGIIIYAEDGKIKIDATAQSLFERNRGLIKSLLMGGIVAEKKEPRKRSQKPKSKGARKKRKSGK